MIEIQNIRDNSDEIIKRLSIKNIDAQHIINNVLKLDAQHRDLKQRIDNNLSESNSIARNIGEFYKQGKAIEATELKSRTTALKVELKELSDEYETVGLQISEQLLQLPNTPHYSVPKGKSAEDNEIVYSEGKMPTLPENALPHWDLIIKYDIVDFELGNKVTGSGFPFYKGKGARLQRSLINFFIDNAVAEGYLEIQPPLLINEASGYGTGQLPDKEGQMYEIGIDKLFLIPTAEVPITNIYRDTIVKKEDLPIKNVAYSNCFRREAGSYGKDVRGLNRLHQFDKVEIVQIEDPENSYATLEKMKEYVAELLRKLELPFRILKLCGGDMSFTSALTYDFEVYSAAQQKWLEVSSVSNFESFQANRMKLRFKDENKKTKLCHTLNGSALALPRIVAALIENNQTDKGIVLPKAITNYAGFSIIN